MKRVLAVLTFAIVSAAALFAGEGYTVTQTVFLPPRFYVGDRVELRLRIAVEPGKTLSVPDTLPETQWIRFSDVSLIPRSDETEIRLVFSSFYPGTQTLPPIRFGDILLDDVKIHTDSLLTAERAVFRGPRSQLLLPGTRLYFALLVVSVLGGIVVLFVVVRLGGSGVQGIVRSYREGRPYRRLMRTLRKLRSEIGSLDARGFYIILLDELRAYLSGKLGRDCRAATTREMSHYLENFLENNLLDENPQEQGGSREAILSLFRQGDLVKFGHQPSPIEERSAFLDDLQEVLDMIEKNRPARKKEAVHVDL